jgi:hypothetical protein
MHPATNSIKYFGVYVIATGIGLTLAPALALAPMGLVAPTEIWVRVLGVLAIVVGYYYWQMGAAQVVAFFRATVRGRILFAALCVLLILASSGPMQLLIFAAVDLAGAAWTARTMGQAGDDTASTDK